MLTVANSLLSRTLAGLVLVFAVSSCGSSYRDTTVTMKTQQIDPTLYAGVWYEIARFPVPFQKGCVATTAEYSVRDADTIGVINTCRDGALDGPLKQIEGSAEIEGPGQLRVRFPSVPFVSSPYWVLWADEAYETAVVGVPSGGAGWILARSPDIDPSRFEKAKEVLRTNGYDTDDLILVPHEPS